MSHKNIFFIPNTGIQAAIKKHIAEPATEDTNTVTKKIRNRMIER
jgi:hypothetical protein